MKHDLILQGDEELSAITALNRAKKARSKKNCTFIVDFKLEWWKKGTVQLFVAFEFGFELKLWSSKEEFYSKVDCDNLKGAIKIFQVPLDAYVASLLKLFSSYIFFK